MPSRRRVRSHVSAAIVEPLEDRTLLAAAGRVVSGFGIGGKISTDFAGTDRGQDVAFQPDGKFVVGGETWADGVIYDFAVARYLADGTPDAAFGVGGRVVTDFAGDSDEAWAVAIQPDGRIVVAGQSAGGPTGDDFALARYEADGTLDRTFGSGGLVTADFGGLGDGAFAVALQADGKIVVAGEAFTHASDGEFAVVRYLPDGSLDATFGAAGKVVTDFSTSGDGARAVVVLADGRIVAGGFADSGPSITDFALACYRADGSLDPGFGTGGRVTTDFDGLADDVQSLVVQADGKLVAAGTAVTRDTFGDFALARYAANGSLDATFGTAGRVTTDVAGDSDAAWDLVAQTDGRLVAAGEAFLQGTDFDFALVRYHADGRIDASFGSRGRVTADFGRNTDAAQGVAVRGDGSLVAAGSAYLGSTGFDVAAVAVRATAAPDDLAAFTAAGQWFVGRGDGTSFETALRANWAASGGWADVVSGDFDGDGRTDVAARAGNGSWWMGRNTGSAFVPVRWGYWVPTAGWRDVRVLDADGDGKSDIVGRAVNGIWWLSRSDGNTSRPLAWGHWAPRAGWRDTLILDADGDGRDDLAGRTRSGVWWVSLSGDDASEPLPFGSWVASAGWRDVRAGDFDGDGRGDIAGRSAGGRWWVSFSDGTAMRTAEWAFWAGPAELRDVRVGDFDGDGLDDLVGRATSGAWRLSLSRAAGPATADRGAWSPSAGWRDVRTGDFDGDGRLDLAGRTSAGQW